MSTIILFDFWFFKNLCRLPDPNPDFKKITFKTTLGSQSAHELLHKFLKVGTAGSGELSFPIFYRLTAPAVFLMENFHHFGIPDTDHTPPPSYSPLPLPPPHPVPLFLF
jgi:hypothetical protein